MPSLSDFSGDGPPSSDGPTRSRREKLWYELKDNMSYLLGVGRYRGDDD
jgi:hypothetical protein